MHGLQPSRFTSFWSQLVSYGIKFATINRMRQELSRYCLERFPYQLASTHYALRTTIFLLFILTISVFPAQAQEDTPDLRFQQLTYEDGLSQSSVRAMLQDQQGFLWLGTWDGLNRFDGYEFVVYKNKPDDSNSLSHNLVTALLEDQDGIIWIATLGGGLNRFDPRTETFTHFRHNPNDPTSLSSDDLVSLYEDGNGTLWVGTWGSGLNRFDAANSTFTHYQPQSDDATSLPHDRVTGMFEDSEGVFWVATFGGGLAQMDRVSGSFTPVQADDLDLSTHWGQQKFVEFPKGTLWILTQTALVKHDLGTETYTAVSLPLPADTALRSMILSADEQLWLATFQDGAGVIQIDPLSGETAVFQNDLTNTHSISRGNVHDIYQDRSGTMWAGVNGALNKFSPTPPPFALIKYRPAVTNSLNAPNVDGILRDRTGNVWVGTNGLDQITPDGTFTHYPADPDNPDGFNIGSVVRAIEEDSEGQLWFGGTGVSRFDPTTGQFTNYHQDSGTPGSLSNNVVLDIHEDENGRIWVATNQGLNLYDEAKDAFINYNTHAAGNVKHIVDDGNGGLWLGSWYDGLVHFDPETRQIINYRHDRNDPDSIATNDVKFIYLAGDGTLWLGTAQGLEQFDPANGKVTQRITEEDGLPSSRIYAILPDDAGQLWILTPVGLAKFNPETGDIHAYDPADGLQNGEFSEFAFYQADDGQIFIGGAQGLNSFYPNQVVNNPYLPPVLLTDLELGNDSVPIGANSLLQHAIWVTDELVLGYDDNVVTFEFAALGFVDPNSNLYQYKLEGFNEDWITANSNRRFATYTNLDPGRYVFRVQATNEDGIWNENGVALAVRVLPPWWQTTWFIGLMILTLVALIYSGYRWRVRSIKNRNVELEQEVEAQTAVLSRVISELQTLNTISETVATVHDLSDALAQVCQTVTGVFKATATAVSTLNDEQNELTTIARYSALRANEGVGNVFPWDAETGMQQQLRAGKTAVFSNAQTHPDLAFSHEFFRERGILGMMVIPLRTRGQVIGVMSVQLADPERQFTPEEQQLGETIAGYVTSAIENARFAQQEQAEAAGRERQRLARELHDNVSQTLFSASLIANALPKMWQKKPELAAENTIKLQQLTRGAQAEMRTLLVELRPAAIAEGQMDTLLHYLGDALIGKTSAQVDIMVDGDCKLPPDVQVALYRITQEALNNIRKHAQATEVMVHLDCGKADTAVLVIRDNGVGFDPNAVPAGHFGVSIMAERAEAINAQLTVTSQPGAGTEIRVKWAKKK